MKLIFFWLLLSLPVQSILSQNSYRAIPVGENNWRSEQMSASVFEKFILSKNIKTVVRLNGDGKDSFGMSRAEEKKISEKHGIKFIYINAHEGYISGQGYVGSGKKVAVWLNKGGCLVHCKWGHDRTGAMVGYFLRKNGKNTTFAVQHNHWKNYLNKKKGNGYKKYYETGTF